MHTADCAVARFPSTCPFIGLSVCLSHASILSKRKKTYHQTIVTVRYPHHFSFSIPFGMAILKRRPPPPLTEGSNAWGMNNCNFGQISRFITEMIQHRARVTMECKWETVPNPNFFE